MKTIYLKAEVQYDYGNDNVKVYFPHIDTSRKCNKKDLEQAQVLAVEELVQYLHDEMKKIEIDMRDDSMKIGYGKYENFDLQKLTELVRGKKRTLEDVAKDIVDAWEDSNMVKNQDLMPVLFDELKQLLKNRE